MTTAAEGGVTKNGELVLIDYELWTEGGGKSDLIDTTREATAQSAGIPVPEGHTFGPRAHLIGGDYFPGGVENALIGAKVGEEWEREFAPADAFGEKDPKLIELFSMHEISRLPEMRRQDAELELGTVLTIKGRRGRVVTLTAARVRVDFNPAFAGRKVRGKFKVIERVTGPVEQAKALIDLTYGHGDDFKVEVHQNVVTVHVPERSKFDFSWAAAKPRVIDQLRQHLKPTSIKIVEEYLTPTPKEVAKEKAAAAAHAEEHKKETEGAKAGSHAEPAHAHTHAPAKDEAAKSE